MSKIVIDAYKDVTADLFVIILKIGKESNFLTLQNQINYGI